MLIVILIVVILIVGFLCAFSGGSTEPTELMKYELVFNDRRVTTVVCSMEELQYDIECIEKEGCKFIAKRRLS